MSEAKLSLLMLTGLPASGKSTYAKELEGAGWFRVNYDKMRWYASDGSAVEYKFSRDKEKKIKLAGQQAAVAALKAGINVVVDNTNLTAAAEDYWRSIAVLCGAGFLRVEFPTDLDECIRRNKTRVGWARVPRPVIERMALSSGRVNWPHPPDKNVRAVIVDIDGTLANGDHRKIYVSGICFNCFKGKIYDGSISCDICQGTGKLKKNWQKYFSLIHSDTPIRPVVEWVKSLKDEGYYVVIVSGRGMENARVTEDQLEEFGVPYDRLFMRNAGDAREDSIIKKEILDAIRPNIEIAFAIDDRPRVIRMWRENGIKVYDVGDGIEF